MGSEAPENPFAKKRKLMELCPLCHQSDFTRREDAPKFFNCHHCHSVFRDELDYMTAEEEKARYLTHNNDVNDQRYQNFVSPIVNSVLHSFSPPATGLDFGAGTGPVIAKLLREKGFEIALWDPFFHPDSSVLNTTYPFIVCCEVMEHLHRPIEEFQHMKGLLTPDGKLFCMTWLISDEIVFKNWNYKNDRTHVIFYSKETIQWIKQKVGFSEAHIDGRLIIFTKN